MGVAVFLPYLVGTFGFSRVGVRAVYGFGYSLPWWFFCGGSVPVGLLWVEIWCDLCGVLLRCCIFELGLGVSSICSRRVVVSLLCGNYFTTFASLGVMHPLMDQSVLKGPSCCTG